MIKTSDINRIIPLLESHPHETCYTPYSDAGGYGFYAFREGPCGYAVSMLETGPIYYHKEHLIRDFWTVTNDPRITTRIQERFADELMVTIL